MCRNASSKKTYFVIIEHEFCYLENDIPWSYEIIAVANSALEAKKIKDIFMKRRLARKGWDGVEYPHWSIKEVPSGESVIAKLLGE